ncbi:MAG: hypothetical protein ABSC63_18205 [Candidatus Binataceae bacterium]|jgi:hypothetical protein
MAVSVRKITLWRVEVDNTPGALASKLEPLAQLGADLQVVMGYKMGPQRAVIELNPVVGRKVADAARNVGFSASPTPAVLVEGDNKPGLGYQIAKSIGEAGINLSFVMALTIGRRYSAVFGFDNAADVSKTTGLIKKAATAKAQRRKAA